ncbi:WbqC-like protein family protein [Pseudoalteromonas sp. P1-9]|uniref:WbqC family protein n=1 Tax=Pseudoalteromonas sp. P1-9 TaxID=1710354 RepID=UPI0006D62127|nr:WbqC family protein [Pseudoalteromonas sp. P1-9]KPV96555.1 WbqC-like protein family protein [Pseudoalteromonas sp. P1-9]
MVDSLSIMQPYFFPYLGYFQLLKATDHLVVLDNVQYPKNSWVNRNRLVVNNKPFYITIPLKKQQSYLNPINEVVISAEFLKWRSKMIKTITQEYSSSPYLNDGIGLFEEATAPSEYVSTIALNSITATAKYLEIDLDYSLNSQSPIALSETKGKDRVIAICKQFNTNNYINLPGGVCLYGHNEFLKHDINLKFIDFASYSNRPGYLSILHLILKFGKEQTIQWVNNHNTKNGGNSV